MSLETKTINFKFAVFEAKQKNSQELKHKKKFGGTKIIFKAINTMILQILFFYQYFFII
jgi:hypothetical protein